jgi:UDP-N-acetylglucosamine:LPS N-acetylglucosamine transferase
MGAKKKIMVASVPVGGGHMAAANAVADALVKQYGDRFEVKLCNVLTEAELRRMVPLDKLAVKGYVSSVRALNSYPYKFFYELADISPNLVNKFFSASFREKGLAYLRHENPDAVVTTFPIISYAVSRIIREGWSKRVPLVSVVTDAGEVNKLWLMDQSDYILVATPETIEYGKRLGVDEDRLKYLGFPVSKTFSQLPDRHQARRDLGLKDMTTIYLTGGGLGLSNKMLRLAKALAKHELGVQYLFVCGRNETLATELRRIKFRDEARVYGFVDQVPTLLAASDLVVGKAGWLTLYEALVARRPTIMIDVIPGQEEQNATYLERHGVGRVIKDVDQAVDAIADYVRHPEHLDAFQENFKRLPVDSNGAERIAGFVAGLIDE